MREHEKKTLKFLRERGWDDLRPADLAKSISIEAAELLELFQWTNQSLAEIKEDREKVEKIKGELADVLIYCFHMSVLLGLDTKKILRDKLEKARQKYPARLFKKRAENVEAGSEEIYWQIKKEHRMKGE